MTAIEPDLVERFTGQRQIVTLAEAEAVLQRAGAAYHRIQRTCRTLDSRLREDRAWAARLNARLWVAGLPGRLHVEGWIIMVVVAGLIGFAASMEVVAVGGGSLLILLATTVAPFALLGLTPVLFPADTRPLRESLDRAAAARQAAQRDRAAAEPMLRDCQRRYTDAVRLRDGLVRARDFPLNQLLHADIYLMSGPEFEAYLASVFRFLGYDVRETGRAGDQGVDMVIGRNGILIAVQAKCYSTPVGNAAVQQVYTGMRIYGCQHCVVIASSGFTQGAVEAARAVNCQLINGRDIPKLIRGQLHV